MQEELVDQIYECAVRSELWPSVLGRLSEIAHGRGGVLFAARAKVLNWTASSALQQTFKTYLTDGWLFRCTRKACLLSRSAPSFLVESDLWTPDELDQNPVYRDFLRPRGLGWSAGTAIRVPTGDNIVISLERDYDKGPVDRETVETLNALLPHISRSAFVSARLGLQHAKGAAETLAALGLPAVVLNRSGEISALNELCDSLDHTLISRPGGRVRLADEAAQDVLDRGLSEIGAGRWPSALSFPLREKGVASKVVHLVPLRRSAQDVFSQSAALLVVTPVAHSDAPAVDLLRSLFDLTVSEAQLARDIAGGQTLQDIAAAGGISINTARFHLKGIMEKTGCRRQGDLIGLLTNLSLVRNRSGV